MDSLFSKFSLQTFLRQFFCGVVFFVPVYIYAANRIGKIGHIEKWETGTFFLFAAVASAVGTIIYHLEKNLYSYPLMYLYEKKIFNHKESKKESCEIPLGKQYYWTTWCVLGVVFLLSIGCINLLPQHLSIILLIAFFGYLIIVTHCILNNSTETIINPTLEIWRIEHLAKSKEISQNSGLEEDITTEKHSAADKLANWSDFIHCTQSCCFAWILGALLAYNIRETIPEGWYHGIAIAILILAAELIIDMHRYRFWVKIRSKK